LTATTQLPRTIVAHLGLARACALRNNIAESRNENERFFSLWRDADADLGVIKQARSEYARFH
jgi:hypothetical protein